MRKSTLEQRRVRQLGWLLYISEGFAANLEHALRTNIADLSPEDERRLERIESAAKRITFDLRRMF